MVKEKVVLITGASGFIGLPFLKIISKLKNYKIIAISRKKQKKIKNVTWVKDALPLNNNSLNIIKNLNIDFLYHLAWDGIPNFSKKNCLKNFKTAKNFINFILLNTKINKIIIAGTCWEYSKNGVCIENLRAKPLNEFAKYKVKLHNYLNTKIRRKKINLYWLRLFYIFGPNQREKSLIPYIVNSAINNREIVLNSDKNVLDFLSVEDVAIALKKFLTKTPPSGIYNIGSGKPISVNKIISKVQNYFKGNVPIKLLNKKSNTLHFWASIKKIKKNINWKPKFTFKSSLEKTIKFYVKKNKN